MTGRVSAVGLAASLALVQVAGAAPARERLRVWLLAPTVAGAEPALNLLRAELAAGGFAVEERPAPGPPDDGAIAHARAAGAFATVIPDPTGTHASAVVLIHPSASAPLRRHALDLGPLANLPDTAAAERLTTLAVRVAEVLQAHARARQTASPTAAVSTAAAGSATTAASDAAAAARAIAGPGHGREMRLEAAVGVGRSVTGVGAAVGPALAFSVRNAGGLLLRAALSGPSVGRPLTAEAGSLRVWSTAGRLELGYEPLTSGRTRVSLAAAAGAQHMLALGSPRPGFAGRTDGALSPTAGAVVSVSVRLHRALSVFAAGDLLHLFVRPEIWIGDRRLARAPRLLATLAAGLRLSL